MLAEAGWTVLVADLKAPADGAPAAAASTMDVRDADDVDSVTAELASGRHLSGLVYAAGVGHVAPFSELSPSRWRFVVDVNLTGAYHVARSATSRMVDGGSIVFISSVDSERPVPGLASYCASKAGVEALSRSIALELGSRGIRSNVVAPGVVQTPLMRDILAKPYMRDAFTAQTPLGAIATPSQIAATVRFLLSDDASHITGARIAVDGGMSLREHPSMLL
jgi:NAD(P)-dependent dehydrogenase (short-subunit alcohol dehydrogenase family)